jgi:hypothetical protein
MSIEDNIEVVTCVCISRKANTKESVEFTTPLPLPIHTMRTSNANANGHDIFGYDASMLIRHVRSEDCSCINFDSTLVSIFIFFTLMYSQDDPSNLCAYATSLLLTGAKTAPDSTQ